MTTTDNVIALRTPDPDDGDEPDEVTEREPTVVELEQYERATTEVAKAVDPPVTHLGLKELIGLDLPERKVIVPKWMKSWPDFKHVVWWLSRYTAHVVTYHVTRSPLYVARVAIRTVVGAARTVNAWWSWQWDIPTLRLVTHEKWLARQSKGETDHSKEARGHAKDWRETVGKRALGAFALLVLLGTGIAFAEVYGPPWLTALALVTAVGALTRIGKPEDKPLIDSVMARPDQVWRMNSKIILEALGGLGIAAINAALKADPRSGIAFVTPIAHEGVGWQVVLDLPKGVTAGDVVERREALAAGLRRPLGCVWPEPVKGTHPGRLELFVADEDMNTARQPEWPLMKSGQVDLFRPVPFGTDQRGRPVWVTLMYASFIIGALPRLGKTFALRLLLLSAALDPRAQLYVHDFKGSGDLSALEHVAHAYTVGDEEEDVELALHGLRQLRQEMRRRYKVLRSLPKDVAPETKVTPLIASDPKLRMHPIVFAADECQCMYEHKKHGQEFEEITTDLVKRGPAAGIMVWEATQRPDAKSIPKPISDNVVLRFCLKVMEWGPNDMVLGSGRYKSGTRATMFAFEDKGVGYFVGEGSDAQIVKTYYANAPQSDQVAKRARKLRERAGTLSGYCIGQQETMEKSATLADDLPRIFVTAERMHSEEIIKALQDLRGGTYDGWTTTTFAMAARDELGLSTTGIKIAGENRQGLRRKTVLDAVEAKAARAIEAPEPENEDLEEEA